jgi:hypothetical protein
MSNNNDVKDIMVDIESVLVAAHNVVVAMQPGERKQIKDLAQDVAVVMGRDPKEVIGFVNHFAHKTSIAYVTRGKNGGLVRGTRPVKVVKPSKKDKSILTE